MRQRQAVRYERGLLDAMARLRATNLSDVDAAWRATVDVLAWLYRCEEAERQGDVDYYTQRNATAEGRTLAGLMWFRGQVEHHQADIEELVGVPITSAGVPLTSKGVPVTLGERRFQWPHRSELPRQQPDRSERDVAYDMLVYGKGVLPPLEGASAWLLAR